MDNKERLRSQLVEYREKISGLEMRSYPSKDGPKMQIILQDSNGNVLNTWEDDLIRGFRNLRSTDLIEEIIKDIFGEDAILESELDAFEFRCIIQNKK